MVTTMVATTIATTTTADLGGQNSQRQVSSARECLLLRALPRTNMVVCGTKKNIAGTTQLKILEEKKERSSQLTSSLSRDLR
jgi:hypothetical protein